ncbi:YkuS family protein [Petroclostridium xylanilyticum]|uniref:YkuS family protein n=1 Tax=Petroclostridium xylanilyticum TaxID=1792311 RepID=UPI000B97E5C6|nr:YkuS family protein [Petroclostridium xylanilyticum]
MSNIGVQGSLLEVRNVLEENGIAYDPLSDDRIIGMQLGNYDIVIVEDKSVVSKNSKDVTVIEAKGISPDEVFEKVKYMQ